MRQFMVALGVAALLSVGVVACGGDDEDEGGGSGGDAAPEVTGARGREGR